MTELDEKNKELEKQHADDAEKIKYWKHEAYKHALRIVNRPYNLRQCDINQAIKTIKAVENARAVLKKGD